MATTSATRRARGGIPPLLLAAAVGLGACSSVESYNPWGDGGSTGLADKCAPSRMLDDQPVPLGLDGYGGASSDSLVIASTDFEGLGSPGGHPMLVGISGGRSMLDAGLAARQIPGVYIGGSTGIVPGQVLVLP